MPVSSTFAESPESDSPWQAIREGKPTLTLRPRIEFVDQDGKTENAQAFTMRTLIGWRTAPFAGFRGTVQGINVGHVGETDFNSGKNGKSAYPGISDPDVTDLNQIYADYLGLPSTQVRLGKQIIKLDSQRFVGVSDFRQTMRVFTGLMVRNTAIPDTEVIVAHLWRIRETSGDQQQARVEIAHADWQWQVDNHLVGYGYFDDQGATPAQSGSLDNSNAIVGVSADGSYPATGGTKLLYTAEYARQTAYAGGSDLIDAVYAHLGGGISWRNVFARADYERLGSNQGRYGFQTRLASRHRFQGWADQLTVTPPTGTRDYYVTLGTKLHSAKFAAEYHWFTSDVGSIRYGDEIDLAVTIGFAKQWVFKTELASFREHDALSPASARRRDTDKLWFTLIYNIE